MDEPLNIKAELRELILRALSDNYIISESCHNGVVTGDHYQSVNMGEIQSTGFRANPKPFLDLIDFEGKKVLDLGSNLGEISRAARARGARLVNGFEYDQYFLQIANLLNAYNEVTGVSFYRCNIVDPSVYDEHYHIVLAFSVFVHVESTLSSIAEITDQALVLETHYEGDLKSTYLEAVLPHFPFYRILGESDHGRPHDASEERTVIVFAKEESALAAVLKQWPQERSSVPENLSRTLNLQRFTHALTHRYIDGTRTPLADKFFSMLEFDSTEDLFDAVADMELNVEAVAKCHDLAYGVQDGWIYWVLYIKGYLQYKDADTINSHNVYHNYLTSYFPRAWDLGLTPTLADPTATAERIALRFRDFDLFRSCAAHSPGEVIAVDPVIVVPLPDPPPKEGDAMVVYKVGSNTPLLASMIDGYHRLFLARLFGVERLPCRVLEEE
jgi:SAM-dependent methyltransferase